MSGFFCGQSYRLESLVDSGRSDRSGAGRNPAAAPSSVRASVAAVFHHAYAWSRLKRLVRGGVTLFLFALLGLVAAQNAAVAAPFPGCTSDMYLAQGSPTTLYRIDASTNPFTYPVLGSAGTTYNAVAFNPADNYLYATRWDDSTSRYRLLRIASNGAATDLGGITGGGINVNLAGIASGEIGADGYYYLKYNSTSTGAAGTLYRVDLSNLGGTTAITLSRSIGSADLAWHNGLLYAEDQESGNFYSINPSSGQVTVIGASGITDGDSFGGMIGASNGVFGAKNGGGFYQFDLATGDATLISSSPASGNNDAAKCYSTPLLFDADLELTKTDGSDYYKPGGTVVYTIVVTNNGPFGVQNATVSDPLPAGITQASWTCGSATGGAVCGATAGTGAINDAADLPANASLTYTLTLTVPENFTGDLSNTATATVPPDTNSDPDGGNDSTTDTDTQAEPGLTVEKSSSLNDENGNGRADAGETISYSFLVTNTGNVTLTNVTVDDPKVTVNEATQTLAPGGSFTFTGEYTITQDDVNNGSVTNTATASGTDPLGDSNNSDPDTVTTGLNPTPGLTIEKNATFNDENGDDLLNAGETISYTFDVENTGNVTLTNVTVDDPLVTVNEGPQMLAPGGTFTFTATYTITQSDVDNGSVTNTATATADSPDGTTPGSDPDSAKVPADPAPGMTVDKQATFNDTDGDGLLDLGETVDYSFVVENTGNVTLTDVTISDAHVTVNEGPQTLAPGATFTFTASYTVTQTDVDTGSVSNTATATGNDPDGNPYESDPDTVKVPADQEWGLTVDKSAALNDNNGNGFADAGETIRYSFLVRNTGTVTLTDVTVNDALVTVGQAPRTLAPGGSFTFSGSYTVTQADVDSGSVTNSATATANDPGGNPIESDPDTVTTDLNQSGSLTIEKSGSLNDANGNGYADAGETISYSFLVINTGNVTLTGVTVNDALVSVNEAPQTLSPGGSFTFTGSYTVSQEDVNRGSVTNSATATGTSPDGDPAESDPDTVTTDLTQSPDMTIEKSATLNDQDGDGVLDLGETISYSFLVENTGNVTLTGVTVDDPLVTVEQDPQTLAPGATFTFTATYTITQADVDAGRVTNTATATGTGPGGDNPSSDPDSVTVPADQTPALTITKSGSLNDTNGNGYADAGEMVSYSFLVLNTGTVTLSGVTVDDALLDVNEEPQTLAPGGSFTFTGNYTITQDDIDAGSLTNTATATGTDPDGNPVESDEDTVITDLPALPRLDVSKSGTFNDVNGNGYSDAGDTITFIITAENTGNVTLTGVVPQDEGPTFNGKDGEGALSPFSPASADLAPGDEQAFTATYTLAEADIENAAGVTDGVSNSASARGDMPDGTPVESDEDTATVSLPSGSPQVVIVAKQALVREVQRGGKAPYLITVTNGSNANVSGITVTDRIPSGFRYVDGSATIDGVETTPEVSGRDIVFNDIALAAGQKISIRLNLLVLSSVSPGKHVNSAVATDPSGTEISDVVKAEVEVVVEPVFDCGDVIGRAFDDLNRNGYPDEGEPGLPGVRIVTVKGWLVTTDKYGRFHVACAALPDQRIGSNFIMKLDPRTLPSGYRLTTENPRVVRLTAGKTSKINFGASIGREVRLDVEDDAFQPGGSQLRQHFSEQIPRLVMLLMREHSVLVLHYAGASAGDTDRKLAQERMKYLEEVVRRTWRQNGAPYELSIETRLEAAQ